MRIALLLYLITITSVACRILEYVLRRKINKKSLQIFNEINPITVKTESALLVNCYQNNIIQNSQLV